VVKEIYLRDRYRLIKAPSILSINLMNSPWHGACFKVQTGDIEDAPALDDLLKFQVRIDGEKVIVIANEEGLDKQIK